MTLFFMDKQLDFLDLGDGDSQVLMHRGVLTHTHNIPQTTKGLEYDIVFTAGAYKWSTKNSDQTKTPYCNVGGWDTWDMWNHVPSRNMDCFWTCVSEFARRDV